MSDPVGLIARGWLPLQRASVTASASNSSLFDHLLEVAKSGNAASIIARRDAVSASVGVSKVADEEHQRRADWQQNRRPVAALAFGAP
jgi:hypothetical protein